jgi:hypothetical protein
VFYMPIETALKRKKQFNMGMYELVNSL